MKAGLRWLLIMAIGAFMFLYFQPRTDTETVDGHDCADLGLSVRWATMDVGSEKVWLKGDYYMWGDTSLTSPFNWKGYCYADTSCSTLTKYCYDEKYGKVDSLMQLLPEDDIVTVRWGGKWRMPTKAELFELRDKCKWEKVKLKKTIHAYKVTGPNGNYIYFPCGGCMDDEKAFQLEEVLLWSSTIGETHPDFAYGLVSGGKYADRQRIARYYGMQVRGVVETLPHGYKQN